MGSAISTVMNETAHRPWPLPQARWVMRMGWHDLLFLHWPVRAQVLRDLIPAALDVDTFDGWAWLGVVPFRMSGVRLRCTPALPWMSDFPEINVRTYVKAGGRSGVWFFSLDATNRLAVRTARAWYGLPYFDARIRAEQTGDGIAYDSVRVHRGAPPAEFQASYRPTGATYRAAPGTIDHWLTERYCLFAADRRGRVGHGDIHHAPWPLQPAEVEIKRNSMAEQIRVELPRERPLAHFARRLDVVAWGVVPVGGHSHQR